MANMTFKANLLPNSNLGYNLGSSDLKWNVYGAFKGNADTATKLATARTISLTGSVTGSGTFDGSGNLSITTTTNHSHSYLPLSGGTMTGNITFNDANIGIKRPGRSMSWIAGRDGALVRTTTISGYSPAISIKTNNGSWEIGAYNSSSYYDDLIYTYCTDTNYNASTNSTTAQIKFLENGHIIASLDGNASTATALTSSAGSSTVPIYFSGGKPVQCSTTLGVSITGSAGSVAWGNVTGKPGSFTPASHSHSYLPLSGGTMTGAINFNNMGGNSIYNGPNDQTAGVGGSLNNLVIGSWWGVSFTSVCGGQTYSGKNAFSIDCRSGIAYTNKMYGAVWNDYAEFRETKDTIQPGRCIHEVGDDTLVLTTERLQKGCEIVSDTYGFAIGESDRCKTPTAASGRVLAYFYEDREIAKQHIGDPVCSGPNGTVSLMTHEEEKEWPSRIIGTISAVPDYEEWECGGNKDNPIKIKINNRIWIRIR